MGIRRRRRKLTTLMSRLDQRVRSVELRPVSLLSTSEIAAAVVAGEAADVPESVVSSSAPAQFRKVQDAYIYPRKLTGLAKDLVEIYLEADLVVRDEADKIEISGIHGTSSYDIDVDGTFLVRNSDVPPWTGRQSWRHDPEDDQLSGVVISNAYSINPETAPPTTANTRSRLQTKRLMDSFAITGSTVTITLNSAHKFKQGDVVFVDINAEEPRAYGLDGLFAIASVPNNTSFTYTLLAGVATPVSSTPITNRYVYPVARRYLPVGSIWVDSGNNISYYWDGIRWVDYSTVDNPIDDNDPPSSPTGLTITSAAKVGVAPNYNSFATVTLAWTAPTTSVSGDPLTDLLNYRIRWRASITDDWMEQLVSPTETRYTFNEAGKFEQGELYYFELIAIDSGANYSTAVTATHTTASKAGDVATYPPTAPVATSRLGTITVTWNGRVQTGVSTTALASEDVVLMRIYVSTVSGFTPSSTNLAKSTRVFGNSGGFDVLTDLQYNVPYYIKITIVNSSGFASDPSAQVTAQVSPLVDTDIIHSTLSEWPFAGGTVPAGALADGSISASGLFGPNVIVQSAIAANAIGADQIAAGSIVAGKIGANAITANVVAANAISAGSIQANAIEADKIKAGAVDAVAIAANAITAGKISAGAVDADKISATAIDGKTITGAVIRSNAPVTGNAARIEMTSEGIFAFNAAGGAPFRAYANGVVFMTSGYTGSLDANQITAGTLTGRSVQTATAGGKRVLMSQASNSVIFYDSDGTEVGRMEGITDGGGSLDLSGRGTAKINIGLASTVVTGNLSTAGTATIVAASRLGQVNWALTGTRVGGVSYNNSGLLVPAASDARLKTNVETIDSALEKISQLNPVTFNWKTDESNPAKVPGLLAQEVSQVFSESDLQIVRRLTDPEATGEFVEDPMMAVDYEAFVPYLIKAVQELSSKNNALEARLAALEGNG